MKKNDLSGGDATIQAVVDYMTQRDLFARSLGIELLEVRPGYSRVGLQLLPHMVNGLNLPHGAAIFALADFGFAVACNSYGEAAVALSMDIHFLYSPEAGARLTCEAHEVRKTRRTGLYRMSVIDDRDNLVAELHGMAYRKNTRFLEEDA